MNGSLALLHVDDDEVEREALRRSLRSARTDVAHLSIGDGTTALTYLRDADRAPDLVLLDWKMPGLDGSGFLERLAQDPALPQVPVIVLSTSDSELDIRDAYDRNASAYVCKRDVGQNFERLIALIDDWADVVSAPPATTGQ